MNDVFNAALSQLRPAWRQILAVHLIYTGLGIILFAPLLGILGRVIIKMSGQPVVADMDLLFFVLSPTGAFAIALFVAVTIVISAFELASLMAISVANSAGKSLDVFGAVAFSLRRVEPIFFFAARLVTKVLTTVVPFLLVASVTAYFLITDYDINYYLAVQPPEFWAAAIIIGILVAIMSVFLIRRLISWSVALPLVLFVGTPPAQSFSASDELTQRNLRKILSALLAWLAVTLSIGALVTVGVRLLAELLVPLIVDSVSLLAIFFGLLTTLWLVASVAATATTAGLLALLLTSITNQLEPTFGDPSPQTGPQSEFNPEKITRRWYAVGLVVAVMASSAIGTTLLDDIKASDIAQIVAHRGAAGSAPENTIAAVHRAIADGADWIEIDVQESADGEIVVIHDSDFMKLAGVNLKVWDATAERLAELDIGSWFRPEFGDERVPTLADVLATVRGRSKLIVELKYYGHDQQLEQRVIDLIEAADMQDDTMIMSLEYAGIQKVRSLRPTWKIGLLSARAMGDLTRLDADFLAVSMALASPAMVKATHVAGKELFVWTVNDALSMSQMMSIGVDGIITDEPQLGREVLAARADLNSMQRLLLHVAPLLGVDPPSFDFESNDAEADNSNINLELNLQQRFQDRISAADSVLAEFTTDGCSGGLSVGWDYFAEQTGFFRDRHGSRPPWESCCVTHDRAYHTGGGAGLTPAQGYAERLQADEDLRACVVETAAGRQDQLEAEYGVDEAQVAALYETISTSMYMAVRLGGMPCTGLSWRWGYGWPKCTDGAQLE